MNAYIERMNYRCPTLGEIEASGYVVEDSLEDVGHIEIENIWIVEYVKSDGKLNKISREIPIDVLGDDYLHPLMETLYVELVRMRGEMH